MEVTELLKAVEHNNASDLHLSPNTPPIIRVNGELIRITERPLTAEETKDLVYALTPPEKQVELEQNLETDFSISLERNMRFRANAYHSYGGISASFRYIPNEIPALQDIYAPKVLSELTERSKGLILVTGATGDGKSTTQAAMLELMNETTARKIITIEDPIEFVYANKKSFISQREVGSHTHSFANALRSALREDPDVIFIGEMRDKETAEMALVASETGHLVISTLHTASAPDAVDRLINMFPLNNRDTVRAMLASTMEAIINQKLLPRKDKPGRIAAFEVLIGTPAVRNIISEGKTMQLASLLQTGSRFGMRSMKESLSQLFEEGVIDGDTLRKFSGTEKESLPLEGEEGTSPTSDTTGMGDF